MSVTAPAPDNERERLAVLKRLDILDTAAEEALDNLVRLAAVICKAPISLISLVDEDRQWFKAKVGLDADETPRELAFCAHAILDDQTMVVEDATNDERFAANLLVTEDPNIRFYAGAQLSVADVNLGTLCVIDDKPRGLDESQLEALEVLRDAVVAQLELRRVQKDMRDLQGMLPVCAWCNSVKTGENSHEQWISLEENVSQTERISHGICPTCAAKAGEELGVDISP